MAVDVKRRLDDIWAKFEQMDNEYTRAVRQFHKAFTNPELTQETKKTRRAEAKKEIFAMVRNYCHDAAKALDRLEAQATPSAPKVDKTDAQRQADLLLWTSIVPGASAAKLRELNAEHSGDPDFVALLEAELAKRKNEPAMQELQLHLNSPEVAPEQDVIDKARQMLGMFAQASMYPAKVSEGPEKVQWRQIDKDLARHPVTDTSNGATYRGAFELK